MAKLTIPYYIFFTLFMCFISFYGYGQRDTIPFSGKLTEVSYTFKDSISFYKSIQKFMLKQRKDGFINISLDTVIIKGDSAIVRIFKGKQYKWKGFSLKNSKKTNVTLKNYKYKQGEIVDLPDLYNYKVSLVETLENSGYPFAKVSSTIETDSNRIAVNFNVVPGRKYLFDTIAFNKSNISATFIEKYLNIKPGTPYSESLVKKIPSKIDQLSFLSLQKKPVIRYGNDLARPELQLSAKKSNYFNGLIGIVPDEDKKNTFIITGDIELALTNSLGRGEELKLKWKKNDQFSQQLDASLRWPYLFNTPLGVSSTIDMIKEDTSFVGVEWSAGIYTFINGTNSITGYYKNKRTIVLTPADTSGIYPSNNYGTGILIESQQLDNILNPSKGYRIITDIGAGRRENSNISDSVTQEKSGYIDGTINLAGFIPIYKNWILNIGNVTSGLYSDKPLFKNDLYRIGGLKTLRGFDENAFFATYYNVSTIELRWLFEQNSHIKLFSDAGWIKTKHLDMNKFTKALSFGLGLNLHTKAGIFTINYALGKFDKNDFLLNNAKIHFGYINNF